MRRIGKPVKIRYGPTTVEMSPRRSTGFAGKERVGNESKSGDLPKKRKSFRGLESGGDDGKVPTTMNCGGTFFLNFMHQNIYMEGIV